MAEYLKVGAQSTTKSRHNSICKGLNIALEAFVAKFHAQSPVATNIRRHSAFYGLAEATSALGRQISLFNTAAAPAGHP